MLCSVENNPFEIMKITDPSNPMYETVRSQLPPELAEAIDRAAAETTTDDVTLEGLKASVDGDVDIDKDEVLHRFL